MSDTYVKKIITVVSSSELTTSNPWSVDASGLVLTLDRSIYQNLSSMKKNQTVADDGDDSDMSSRYADFITAMSKLHAHMNIDPTLEYDENLIELDVYLGQLGLEEEYPESRDWFWIKDFVIYNPIPEEEK